MARGKDSVQGRLIFPLHARNSGKAGMFRDVVERLARSHMQVGAM